VRPSSHESRAPEQHREKQRAKLQAANHPAAASSNAGEPTRTQPETMSITPIGGSDIDRFERALLDAGYEISERPASRRAPWRYTLKGPHETGPFALLLYLWPLREEHPGERGGSVRVGAYRPAGGPFAQEPGAVTLLLGYHRPLDLYAGWPFAAHRDARPGSSLRVPHSTLIEARETGLAVTFTGRGAESVAGPVPVTAFTPENLGLYLERERDFGFAWGLEGSPLTRHLGRDIRAFPAAGVPFPAFPGPPSETPPAAVQTGFAPLGTPRRPLTPEMPLRPGASYYYWFGVGVEAEHSIEVTPVPLPELAGGSELTVQLFAFPEELELTGATSGTVQTSIPYGTLTVTEPAARPDVSEHTRSTRLFFGVRAPQREGAARLRCNVYLGSTLVQSRLITCQVGVGDALEGPALLSQLDYALSRTLDLDRLALLPEHELSLMVNGDEASHQFRFFSLTDQQLFANEASIDATAIDSAIEKARGALRRASWGTEAEWDENPASYRYKGASHPQFAEDLVALAIRGRQLYAGIAGRLAGSDEARRTLLEKAAKPGRIQIATSVSGLYLPAALLYDHKLETMPGSAAYETYRLCEEFQHALAAGEDLTELPCFSDGCPTADEEFTVCPSGFWGYRHEIGWPIGVGEPPIRPRLPGIAAPSDRPHHRPEVDARLRACPARPAARRR
jgi:hypothetical protein